MNKRLLWGLLMAVLTLGWVGTAPQASAATSSCDGVWVVVDYGSIGGTSAKCTSSHSTGKVALTSAGFSPTLENGMITRISGNPGNPDINKDYWSYWTATLKSDGSYTGWRYSNLGATSSHPVKGNAEGWRYQPLSDGKLAPGLAPPQGKATPKPSPTPTKAPTKPTATAKPTASAKPTATASAKKTASASAPASATATATATQAASAEPTPTPPVATPTGSESATAQAESPATPAQPAPDRGSPVGAIAAGAFVAVGGAGVGGWWLLKGRRR